jgi:hypothetical protein
MIGFGGHLYCGKPEVVVDPEDGKSFALKPPTQRDDIDDGSQEGTQKGGSYLYRDPLEAVNHLDVGLQRTLK